MKSKGTLHTCRDHIGFPAWDPTLGTPHETLGIHSWDPYTRFLTYVALLGIPTFPCLESLSFSIFPFFPFLGIPIFPYLSLFGIAPMGSAALCLELAVVQLLGQQLHRLLASRIDAFTVASCLMRPFLLRVPILF